MGFARAAGSVLLLAVIILVVMGLVRFAVRGPTPTVIPPAASSGPAAAPAEAPRPASVAAGALLARIKACSQPELENVIDQLSPLEAVGLYHLLTPSDREVVLAAVPYPLLAKKAHSLLGIPEAPFRHADQPGRLASTLIDAAMGVGSAGTGNPAAALSFAVALDNQHAPLDPRLRFQSTERRIYACLDGGADSAAVPGVLVRWSREGTDIPLYLRYLPLALNRRWNYIYYDSPTDWPAGTYRVALFGVEEVARLLAEGTFVVGPKE